MVLADAVGSYHAVCKLAREVLVGGVRQEQDDLARRRLGQEHLPRRFDSRGRAGPIVEEMWVDGERAFVVLGESVCCLHLWHEC